MQNERGLVRRSAKREDGMTLVEVMISTLVLTVGMVGVAGLLAVTTSAQIGARESARSVRLAQEKIDELVKLPFTDVQVAVGGSLDENVANHNEAAAEGITIRWLVAEGPTVLRELNVGEEPECARLVDVAVFGALRTGAGIRIVPSVPHDGLGAILRF